MVTTALGQDHVIVGKGNVQLPMQNDEIKTIKDVCSVPRFNKNLLSMGQITDSSNVVLFTNSMCLVLNAKKILENDCCRKKRLQVRAI